MTELINTIEQLDTQIFLCFNGMHNAFWDYFMMIYSSRFVWIPFYVSFLYVMFKNYSAKSAITTLIAIICIILLCDQTSSSLLKPMVERMRPSNIDNPISPLVHIVSDYRGGKYGFPSSHAANAWGLVFFSIFLTHNKKLACYLLTWAVLMAYSRIYLGLHYPGDLLVGVIIGLVYAWAIYKLLMSFYREQFEAWKDSNLHIVHAQLPAIVGGISILLMLISAGIMTYTEADIFFN